MTDQIIVDRQGFTATVTLNQPAKLNAVSLAMWDRLGAAFSDLDRDQDLRCIILRGAGERAFSVGADISEFEEHRSTAEKARAYGRRTHAAMAAIVSCRHPVIARIDGLCVGGGLELATTADLRICSARSRFGIPIKRLGLVVAYAELEPLIQLIGPANAKEILLEGQIFGADRACAMGLVNRVVGDENLDQEMQASANRIAEGAPLVARWHKKFTRRLLSPEALTPEEQDESYACFATEDFRTGYKAFLAKKTPVFSGR
ncbi:MAG: enoyl-CoA hydratase/isomerase family protein [Rhizobiales bacterium]|nr:enoyl-CoA hydratase/isomerase family protein [Hyphomicrobiales bacterium]